MESKEESIDSYLSSSKESKMEESKSKQDQELELKSDIHLCLSQDQAKDLICHQDPDGAQDPCHY